MARSTSYNSKHVGRHFHNQTEKCIFYVCATVHHHVWIEKRYQLDATIMIYYQNYLYMFQASTCPSSRVQVVCYYIWCSALGVVAVVPRSRCVVLCTACRFVSDSQIQTYTQCTRPRTGALEPQPQHLVLNTICSSIQPVLLKMGM